LLLILYRSELIPSWHGAVERVLATLPLLWIALLALGQRPEPRPSAAEAAPGRPRRSTTAYPKRPVM
jgi:hypothetical protein